MNRPTHQSSVDAFMADLIGGTGEHCAALAETLKQLRGPKCIGRPVPPIPPHHLKGLGK